MAQNGFPSLMLGRPYDPVHVKIKIPHKAVALDRYSGRRTYFYYGPFEEWTPTLVLSAETDYRIYSFFVKHPVYAFVHILHPSFVLILFEAESFFYLMRYASRGNKLNFFRHTVVESPEEAEKFCNMVKSSDLSDKDKRRALTWVYRRQKNLGI